MSFRFLLAGLVLTAICTPAEAATTNRQLLSHGVANCQAALPVFDGNIRKRPKGIGNEGTSTAFVTCDFEHLPNAYGVITSVGILVRNNGGASATFTCTLVQGFGSASYGANIVKSANVSAGSQASLFWFASDNGDVNLTLPSVSCSLAPGMEIHGTMLTFTEEIGT